MGFMKSVYTLHPDGNRPQLSETFTVTHGTDQRITVRILGLCTLSHSCSFLLPLSGVLEGRPPVVPASLSPSPGIFWVPLLSYIQAFKEVVLEFSLEPFTNRLLKISSFKSTFFIRHSIADPEKILSYK